MTKNLKIYINQNSNRKLKSGYPWVFRSELLRPNDIQDLASTTQLVDFVRHDGEFIARGFLNSKTQLVGRVLSLKEDEAIDQAFFEKRIQIALDYRNSLYSEPYYRLVHAESDGFPGLIVDRYGDVLSVQVNTAGMEMLWPQIQAALEKIVKPKDIILKNETAIRATEGLEQWSKSVNGNTSQEPVTIQQGKAKFYVDVLGGQKTGWFFDQRDNRAWVGSLSNDKSVIDIFSHTGGFGIVAGMNGAKSVTFVDSSASALEMVQKNAKLNGIEKKCDVIEGAAFDVMEKLVREGKKFDVVSVDPPAFVKSRKDLAVGLKGYEKLARIATQLVAPQGVLFYASCSSHVGTKELFDATTNIMMRSNRAFQLIKTSAAGADHPVHPKLPETEYLTALTFKFLD